MECLGDAESKLMSLQNVWDCFLQASLCPVCDARGFVAQATQASRSPLRSQKKPRPREVAPTRVFFKARHRQEWRDILPKMPELANFQARLWLQHPLDLGGRAHGCLHMHSVARQRRAADLGGLKGWF